MRLWSRLIIFGIIMLLTSCLGGSKIDVEVYNKSTIEEARITNVKVEGNQLYLTGKNLGSVTKIKVEGPNSFKEFFSVNSKNKQELYASGSKDINFQIGSLFNFILSDAYGSTTFLVDFTLQDGSVTNSKISENAITGNKIHHMGASDGDALVYNNGTGQWEARSLNGLSLKGSWNANINSPSLASGGANTSPFSGDYYLVSDNGSTLLDGINVWNVGDWVIFNGTTWDYISNSSGMVSFNGRQGMVVPAANDYTWNEIDKTTSDINDIANVDTAGVSPGKILKFDGTKWAIADDDNAGGPGSVTTTEILDGTISNDDLAGSIAQAKVINLTTDLAARLKVDGSIAMTGALDMGIQAITNVGNVDGVDVSSLNTVVGTNTTAIATNGTNITARLPLAGGTMTGNIAFSGAETVDGVDVSALNTTVGTNVTNIANNTTAIGTKLALDGSAPMTAALDLGNNKLKLKSDNANYVELIAPNTLAATYTLTYPGDDGTAGQLLSTNGTGTLSWVAAGGAGDFKADGTVAMAADLDLGNNKLKYKSDNANFVEMIAPTSLGATYTLTLPVDDGTAGQVLSTNGTGILAWASGSTGTVTSVAAGTGLTGGAITTTGTLNVDVGTGANQIVQLDGTSKLPAVDGSQLTNLVNPTSATVLTGFVTGADSTVLNTDTVEVAFEKLQGQIDGNNTDIAALPSLGTASGDAFDIGSVPNCSATEKLQMSLGPVFTISCVTTDKNSVSLGNLDNVQQMPLTYLDTDVNLAADSDVKVPSQKAIKAYVDAFPTNGEFGDGGDIGGANRALGNADAFNLGLLTNNLTRLQILSSGEMSIGGDTTPDAHLEVSAGGTTGGNVFLVSSDDDNDGDLLTIDEEGNVGIGSTTPADLLEVKKIQNGITQINVINTDSGTNARSVLRLTNNTTSAALSFHSSGDAAGNARDLIMLNNEVTGNIKFKTNGSNHFIITDDGNLGIGTDYPDAKLQISGGGLCVGSDTTCNTDNDVEGVIYAVSNSVTAADYAEYFYSEGELYSGDIVGLSPSSGLARFYQKGDKVLGIVSTKPGIVGNSELKRKKNTVLVALMGQVPVNKEQVIQEKLIVKTIDGKVIGHKLASGDIYINISSVDEEQNKKISSLEIENNNLKQRLRRIESLMGI